MKITGRASIGQSPDVLAFDTSLRRLYVSAESGDVAVFAERGRGLAAGRGTAMKLLSVPRGFAHLVGFGG